MKLICPLILEVVVEWMMRFGILVMSPVLLDIHALPLRLMQWLACEDVNMPPIRYCPLLAFELITFTMILVHLHTWVIRLLIVRCISPHTFVKLYCGVQEK